jgi:hypothetical protein
MRSGEKRRLGGTGGRRPPLGESQLSRRRRRRFESERGGGFGFGRSGEKEPGVWAFS